MRTFTSKLIITISFLVFHIPAQASFWLCGADEDGCDLNYPEYCLCVPVDINYEQPYCMDFNAMQCNPTQADCADLFSFKNQKDCLAVLLQSSIGNHCIIVSDAFCYDNNAYICDKTGSPNSCKK